VKYAVVADNLHKTFRTRRGGEIKAVDGVSFHMEPGELFSLLGPNGAGKTTTISMLCGLLAPTSGAASIQGVSMGVNPLEAKKHIGIVPQEIALYPRLTARQNLEFFGRMYGLFGMELSNRVGELLEFVELSDRADDRVENFSGGMKRRVNIAVGLLHRPPVLFMDEPTAGVDPQSRRRILDTIEHLKKDHGIAILYTTHLMEEAQELSDRVGIIDHGKLIAVGTQGELTNTVNQLDRVEIEIGEPGVDDRLLSEVRRLPDVADVMQESALEDRAVHVMHVLARDGRRVLPAVIEVANRLNVRMTAVYVHKPDLESVFLSMTGRALRD
jgi:ABC-2 type transport system ATP-binding protein